MRGFSTLEILIAFSILTLALTATIGVVFSGQSLAIDTQTNIEAIDKAQIQLEAARALSRQNFASVQSSAPVQDGIYTKSLTISSIDALTKQAQSTVSWVMGGRTLSVSFSTLLADWQNGVKCSPTLSGDWTAPQVYGYVDFPSPKGAEGIDVQNGKAYIVSDPNSATTDDFYIVDISAAGPGVTTLPTLGHFSTTYGLTDVRVSGNYAYTTADSGAYQLVVVNVTNVASPTVATKLDLTVPGDTAVGNTIAYAGGFLYLGLTKSNGPEFYIIDVSNPLSPVVKGSYEVNAAVNSILVKNKIAYIATASNKQIVTLDVSNPSAISALGIYNATIPPYGQALALNNAGNRIYFGQTDINGPKLFGFDTSNLSGPSWSIGEDSGVYSMILRGAVLFITTGDPVDGLQIWDVSNPTAQPTRFDTSPLNIQQGAKAGADCAGNLLYVAQRSNRAMQVVGPYVTNDYALANNGDITLTQGNAGNTTINATLVSGVAQKITFSTSALPAGVTASFSPKSCTVSCSSVLTLTTALTTPSGTYPITVNSTGGRTTMFNLVVNPAPFDYSLSNNGNVSIKQNTSGAVTISSALVSGVSKPVTLSLSSSPALPASVTTSFDVNKTCSPTCSSNLTISPSADPATKNKTYTLMITGTPSGVGPRTTSFTVTIKP